MPVKVMARSFMLVGRPRRLTTTDATTPCLGAGHITGLLGLRLTAKWKSTTCVGWSRNDRHGFVKGRFAYEMAPVLKEGAKPKKRK